MGFQETATSQLKKDKPKNEKRVAWLEREKKNQESKKAMKLREESVLKIE